MVFVARFFFHFTDYHIGVGSRFPRSYLWQIPINFLNKRSAPTKRPTSPSIAKSLRMLEFCICSYEPNDVMCIYNQDMRNYADSARRGKLIIIFKVNLPDSIPSKAMIEKYVHGREIIDIPMDV